MKFTLSWLRDHLDTTATTAEVVAAMTMAGLEVEHVDDPAAKLSAFTVARIVEAVPHPNADRLRVCQVDTIDGRKEIVCGAPNARAGLTTVYAPIGAFVPGLGVTLVEKPVRGVVSMGMLCSASELETASESDGIMELEGTLAVGAPVAEALGLEAVIDFEVTPNRPDWLGVAGIARDLAAAGLGTLKDLRVEPIPGQFPCPIAVTVDGEACPVFAGRLIRGVTNGPSPAWLQARLAAVGLRAINALVDVTNLISYDRCRPLHVYDASKLTGSAIEARLGHQGEQVSALDGKTYLLTPSICAIADESGAIGLGGVMGGASTGCSETTTDVFIESAWFDPIRTAQTGRDTGIYSDAQYRFARGVDTGFVIPGLELATRLILDLCGGEASEIVVAGEAPAPPTGFPFDPAYVEALSGLSLPTETIYGILTALGFAIDGETVTPPSWRRDVEGKADLVEEVARIAGFDALPATPLPDAARANGGVLNQRQRRVRFARRALAAMGFLEALGWSFTSRRNAQLFGGGDARLVLSNPIASELDCMRPSPLPGLIEATGRNARRGFPDVALFEIGPVFAGDQPADQRLSIAAVMAAHPPRRWDKGVTSDIYSLKADLLALMDQVGVPVANLQLTQGTAPTWWHPGRSASVQLGPKSILAVIGEIHPAVLKALDVDGPIYAFEFWPETVPEPKARAVKTKAAFKPTTLMPLSRDFAFVTETALPAERLVRTIIGADRTLISAARVFDVYVGPGVPDGAKSVAVEVAIQPTERTLTDSDIEALSNKIIAAAQTVGARLRQ